MDDGGHFSSMVTFSILPVNANGRTVPTIASFDSWLSSFGCEEENEVLRTCERP
jgi:hypothetical protein